MENLTTYDVTGFAVVVGLVAGWLVANRLERGTYRSAVPSLVGLAVAVLIPVSTCTLHGAMVERREREAQERRMEVLLRREEERRERFREQQERHREWLENEAPWLEPSPSPSPSPAEGPLTLEEAAEDLRRRYRED